MSDTRKIIKSGVFLLAVIFAVLSIFFSPEYISGASRTVSAGTVLSVTASLLSLICCAII